MQPDIWAAARLGRAGFSAGYSGFKIYFVFLNIFGLLEVAYFPQPTDYRKVFLLKRQTKMSILLKKILESIRII